MTSALAQDPDATVAATRRAGVRQVLPSMTPKLAAGLIITGLVILFGVIGPLVVGDPNAVRNIGLSGPSGTHILGTTQTGQDVFSQLAYATRGSLIIGFIVGVLAMFLSAFFGIVGAYVGGFLDDSFSLFTNVMLVIPGLPLVIVMSSYVQQKSIYLIAGVLAVTSWAGGARVLRSVTLSLRNRDYVAAAKVSGERSWRIMLVEILPNLVPVMASQFVFAIIFAILGEAGLSFLGLGASGALTWGTMLYYAQNGLALRLGAWWWFIPPGLLIAAFGAALSLINFSIDEIINPKLRDQTRSARKRWTVSKEQLKRVSVEDVP